MNKRGQAGLPMNTLIVAIIAIIVLLLIVTFFTGGLGTIGEKIREIFGAGTAGSDLNLATQFCKDYCSAAKNLPDDEQKLKSAYCKKTFDIKNPDGTITENQQCTQLGVSCSGVDNINGCVTP